ncbi:hypothetical protein GIS00_04525 [Nakamurella sp. YIM 132087]|uniref:Carbohydrate kinase PfkB domain-containing protein n=1 Tax=Nakamurella alba TaxID=2665158 RepID=A0A7K1FGH1_9ACTN|nr:PfkB family carbohydrate kinase [Nakamurella alba]MTD13211.1 hypothetical protein [Nakamurella alba]
MTRSADRRPTALLTCVGDLVEDIVVRRTGPSTPDTDNPSSITRGPGGSAANVATLAAAEVPTRFIGRVGADAVGRDLADRLRESGVDVQVQTGGRTGTVVVIVDEAAGRTMYPDRAAAAELAAVPGDWVIDTGILHISAYALQTPDSADTVCDLATAVRLGGGRVSLDASSADLLVALGSTFTGLLDVLRPDLVFANEDEAALLPVAEVTGRGGCYVVKNGADPVFVHEPDGTVLEIPVPPVALVLDTTGAGDAFAAGFLTSVLQGSGHVAAAERGNHWAAASLGVAGAARAVPPVDPAPANRHPVHQYS